LTYKHFHSIVQFIDDNWENESAWPDFVEAMRLLLPDVDSEPSRNDRWALLPGLCCQAAGGDFQLTKEVSAAWILLHIAGHLVDGVEDGDRVAEIQALGGPGAAINVANGYFLSAALMLNDLSKITHSKNQAHQIGADFYNTILVMASGQHQDINFPQLSLRQWWQVAEAKTGSFFSLACRSGARLATSDTETIAALSDYGFHLGLMLQIHDDVEDLQQLMAEEITTMPDDIQRSLAIAYAVNVLPEAEKNQLQKLIETDLDEPERVNKILDFLDRSGAGLYLLAEMERHYASGVKSLQAADPLPKAADQLLEMIGGLKLQEAI
jgi:geranylgeranyl pyrophosphate synthase